MCSASPSSCERWNQHLWHVESVSHVCASSMCASKVSWSLGNPAYMYYKAGCHLYKRFVRRLWVCSAGWSKWVVCVCLFWMTQSFVHGWWLPWVKKTPLRTWFITFITSCRPPSFLSSLCFGLWLVSSLTGNICFNALSFFILDALQDTLATPWLDRDAPLVAMKSTVRLF